MPPPPVDLGGTVEQLAVGHDHSCVLLGSGNVRCSGRGLTFGSLGYASTDNVGDDPGEMPPPDVDIGGKAVQVFVSGISFSKPRAMASSTRHTSDRRLTTIASRVDMTPDALTGVSCRAKSAVAV